MYYGMEKRGNKRIVKPITASFRIRSDEARKAESNDWDSVNLLNLSAGGTFFIHRKDLGIGTLLDLKIDISEYSQTINCVGRITRSDKPHPNSMFCFAIKFIDIEEQEEEMLKTAVEDFLEYEDQNALTTVSFTQNHI